MVVECPVDLDICTFITLETKKLLKTRWLLTRVVFCIKEGIGSKSCLISMQICKYPLDILLIEPTRGLLLISIRLRTINSNTG